MLNFFDRGDENEYKILPSCNFQLVETELVRTELNIGMHVIMGTVIYFPVFPKVWAKYIEVRCTSIYIIRLIIEAMSSNGLTLQHSYL